MTNTDFKNTIFISHSSKDEVKARNLKKFLEYMMEEYTPFKDKGYKIFFAPDSLPRIDDGQKWKDILNKELRKTSRFISLISPNSLYSRWSNYEFGYVSALENAKIIPISNLKHFDVDKTILGDLKSSVVRPLGYSNIKDAVVNVSTFLIRVFEDYKDETPEQNSAIKVLSQWFYGQVENGSKLLSENGDEKIYSNERLNKLEEFVSIQSHRTIYIVGSKTKNSVSSDSSYIWNKDNIKKFVSQLSDKLLRKGLTLASSPRVPDIGETVARMSIPFTNQYEIIGLYKIEQALPKSKLSKSERTAWEDAIKKHRVNYLDMVDAYIVLGGNDNTRDEYNSVTDKHHIIVLPLPCFGGISREIYNKHKDSIINAYKKIEYPCCKCNLSECNEFCGCPNIDMIVELLEIFCTIEWNELRLH